jgi:hypothetical protein
LVSAARSVAINRDFPQNRFALRSVIATNFIDFIAKICFFKKGSLKIFFEVVSNHFKKLGKENRSLKVWTFLTCMFCLFALFSVTENFFLNLFSKFKKKIGKYIENPIQLRVVLVFLNALGFLLYAAIAFYSVMVVGTFFFKEL